MAACQAPDTNQQRDFISDNATLIDQGLGMNILRQVHATYSDTPGVIGYVTGRKEPYIYLGLLEDEMVDRIYRMVHAQKARLSGKRSEPQ
jgi:hypothetical protein